MLIINESSGRDLKSSTSFCKRLDDEILLQWERDQIQLINCSESY
jgi:hypothetical protein